jgi:hypothetical protein
VRQAIDLSVHCQELLEEVDVSIASEGDEGRIDQQRIDGGRDLEHEARGAGGVPVAAR